MIPFFVFSICLQSQSLRGTGYALQRVSVISEQNHKTETSRMRELQIEKEIEPERRREEGCGRRRTREKRYLGYAQ